MQFVNMLFHGRLKSILERKGKEKDNVKESKGKEKDMDMDR